MTERLIAVLALVVLAGFLGILVWRVPDVALVIVVATTLALAAWDLARNHFGRRR